MSDTERATHAMNQALASIRTALSFMADTSVQENMNEFVFNRLVSEMHDCAQGVLLSIEAINRRSDDLKKEVIQEAVESSDLS